MYLYHPPREVFSHETRVSSKNRDKKKTARSVLLHLFISLHSVSLSHPSMTNEELLLSQLGKNLKNGERRRGKKNLISLPDVLRVVSRRAPRRHHVTNLVRVAFESVALVFLFFMRARKRKRERKSCVSVIPYKNICICNSKMFITSSRMSSSSFFMETSSSCKPFMRSWSARKEDEDAMREGGGVKMGRLSLCLCLCVFVFEKRVQFGDFLSVEKLAFLLV